MDRQDFLKDSITFLDQFNKRKLLEIKFKNEVGTGLGPTLGFYSELADQVKSAYGGKLWKTCSDNSLFPMPRSFKGLEAE